ncbi:MAG: pentapeptide repeat-containing protein [Terriglobales bacterium]
MSSPNWRTLLAASVIVAINPAMLRATPPSDNTPAYRPISLGTFLRMVSAGRVIRGRLVPPDYIASVLTNADKNPPKQSPHALRLKFSKVTDGTIRPKSPTREQPDAEKSAGAVHLALPIEISDTEFDANLYLDDVVIDKSITLDKVDFRQSVYFRNAVFQKPVVLKRTRFRGVTDFSNAFLEERLSFEDCQFNFQANFAHLTIPSGSWLNIRGGHISAPLNFYGSQISGALVLEGGLEGTLQVGQAVYLNGVNGDLRAPAGTLSLKDIVFHDNVYMDHSKWERLDLGEFEGRRHRPVRFLEFYDLQQGLFGTVDLSGAEFDRGGDFSDSKFQTAISFEGTRLRQPVRVKWDKLKGKLMLVTPSGNTSDGRAGSKLSQASYEELERNFKNLGDIDSQNGCNYERRWKYQEVSISFISWVLSGYWVVWWVPLLWVLGSLLAFYCINRRKFDQQWFGLTESAAAAHFIPEPWALTIQATFRLVLPKEYRGTAQGRRLYLLESLWLKFFVGVFIFTLKNTSPLLRDLLPYLLPK